MSITETPAITTEQLLAIPDDGMERELICGELKGIPMTVRNRFHRFVATWVAFFLEQWRRS